MASRRPRRRLAFWLVIASLIAIWVWRWPARQPVDDTIDQLGELGYRCDRQPDSEMVYFCSDPNADDPTDPKTKTSLWLYSPYRVVEAEVLMDAYCPRLEPLWRAGLNPTGWEVDQQLLIIPHELYARADLIDQFPPRQTQLEADLGRLDQLGQVIDLDTRCNWYLEEPAGGSLV